MLQDVIRIIDEDGWIEQCYTVTKHADKIVIRFIDVDFGYSVYRQNRLDLMSILSNIATVSEQFTDIILTPKEQA